MCCTHLKPLSCIPDARFRGPGPAEPWFCLKTLIRFLALFGCAMSPECPFGLSAADTTGVTEPYSALQEGALIIILERMNRIHEVDEELCYAVIEPGVSQGQLNEYLKNTGSNLWIDCTDSSPDGSLIGNALDKGVGYTPYGDHFGHLCGMEVVLANGDISYHRRRIRTMSYPVHV